MAESNVFPAIIRPEYDGSSGFPQMVQDAQNASEKIKQRFANDFNAIGVAAGKSLSTGLSSGGAIDAQVSQFRQAAAEAKALSATLSNMQRVQTALAASTGDTSAATTKYLQALNAQVIEARQAERAAESMVATQTRLQAAYDATASTNSRLSESYRNLFVEQGRAAKIEQQQRARGDAFGAFVTGGGSGKSAQDSAGVFQAMLDEKQAADAARQAIDLLRQAEAGAAAGTRFLADAYRGTAEEIGRTTKSARESAEVFEQAERAQQEYAQAANRLRGQLDPLFNAQQRFDREMIEADRLLDAGAISTREYAAAQQLARDNLQAANTAIQQQGTALAQATRQAKQGTTANQQVVNSTRAVRQATVQAGQQFQDIAISIGSGQRASTVFAQQLPQLAFALSGVKGRVGEVATFLAGPWGVALAIGAFALGPLIDGLFKAEKASKDTGKATDDLANRLDLSKNSYTSLIAVVNEYNNSQEKTEALTYGAILAAENQAVALIKLAKAKIALLEASDPTLDAANSTDAIGGLSVQRTIVSRLREQIDGLEKELSTTRRAAADNRVEQRLDPEKKIQTTADLELIRLRERNKQKLLSDKDYENQSFAIKKKAQEDIAALRKKDDSDTAASDRDNRSRAKVLADFRRELEKRGVRTLGDGYRTAEEQNKLFRKGDTPADGYKIPSRHQSFRAIDIDKSTFNEQAIYEAGQAAGIRGLRILTESRGRKHLDFTGSGKPGTVDDKAAERQQREADKAARALEKQAREAIQLQNELDGISNFVLRIGSAFDEQPKFIDRATIAANELRLVLADIDKQLANKDITADQRAKLEADKKAANKTLNVEIPRTLRQPFEDITEQAERELKLQNIRLEGREVEAELLQKQYALMEKYGAETEEQLATALIASGITKEQYETQVAIQKVLLTNRNIEQERLERLGQTIEDRLGRLRELREVAISTISEAAETGKISAKNLFSTINRQFADQFGRDFFEKFLGGAFTSEEDRLKDLKNQTDGELILSTNRVIAAFDMLANKGKEVVTGLPSEPGTTPGSTVAEAKIIVDGIKTGNRDFAKLLKKTLVETFGVSGPVATALSDAIQGAFEGAQSGGFVGSAFGATGGKIGRGIGGALGGINKLLGPNSPLNGVMAALPQVGAVLQAGSAISKLLGGDQVKNGKIFGPLSPFLTPLLGSSLRGTATIGGVNGSLGITGTRGNSRSRKKTATDNANGVIDQLNSIAEQLGVSIDASLGSASIGQRKKSFVVDRTGRGRTKGSGVENFGKGEEGAIAAARALALDLITDGVLVGLREGSKKLLANAKSLEQGLEKALKFQSVFDRLEQRKDPFGFALKELNREFTNLVGIFKEAGASAAEFAQLEELYGLERAEVIKETSEQLTSSLRDLIDDLKTGDNGLSLRDRLSNVRAQFDPLANDIRSGKSVDYDKFAEVARNLIDIQRQISGSQSDYFNVFNEVLGLSEAALAAQRNVISIGSGIGSPFSSTAVPSNDNTPVVSAINSQTNALVASLAAVQAQIASLGTASGGGGGGTRGFSVGNNENYF